MRIAILAALPGELKPLVRRWTRVPSPTRGISIWIKNTAEDELIAVCGGMGTAAAIRSFAAAEHIGTLDMVLSVGWAGALQAGILPGRCYVASQVIDSLTGERYTLTNQANGLRLVTTPLVAGEAEKVRLRDTYGAALVDMEAAAVVRLAQMRHLPVHCLKAVSDGIDASLPDLNPYIDEAGQFRLLTFLGYVAVRPRYWAALMRLGKISNVAASTLATAVERFLGSKDFESIESIDSIDQTGVS